MTVSVDGQPEAGEDVGQSFLNLLIRSFNEGDIVLQGSSAKALLDTGSMVSTVSQSFYDSLADKPELNSLDALGLNVSIAAGTSLNYSGFIECNILIPFLSDISFDVPVLVVPDNHVNSSCPVIIGTNVIR